MSAKVAARRSVAGSRAGAMAAVLMVGIVVVLGFQTPSEIGAPRGALLRPGVVLPGGTRASLAEAAKSFSVPIFRPGGVWASDANLRELWIRTVSEPEVYMTYNSGVVVTVRPESIGQGTTAYAEAQVKDGVPGRLVNIGPYEAFLVPEVEGPSMGSVRFIMDGAIITVIGNGTLSAGDLVDIGESIVDRSAEIAADHA